MTKLLTTILLTLNSLLCLAQQKSSTKMNIRVYDEIYTTLKENYPLFKCRSYYNLDSAYLKYKSQIVTSIDTEELGNFSCKMISELNDFHVRLYAGKNRCYALSTPLNWHKIFHSDSLQKVFWANSDQTLYKAGFTKIQSRFFDEGQPMMRYAKSSQIAYLNIIRFEFKFSHRVSRQHSAQIALLIDSLVQDFKDSKALIIDLRSCMGGNPEYGEIIANRLTKEKKTYSLNLTFKTAKDSLSPVEHYIQPQGRDQLNIPIIVLTNKVARSAAEHFILMLKQIPGVYIIGEPSWGAFANSKTHTLPNGWKLQYSTEKVYAPNEQIYEGKGIPVDLPIDNSWDDIISQNDKVISAALLHIKNK